MVLSDRNVILTACCCRTGYLVGWMQTTKDNRWWLFAFTHWNWKAAVITAIFRGAPPAWLHWPNVHPSARPALQCRFEMAYVLLTAGIFSAWQRAGAWPQVPAFRLARRCCHRPCHFIRCGCACTQMMLDHINAHTLGLSALAFSLVSAMFHWHVMQNGVMLVGEESRSLSSDLRELPRLLLSFVAMPIRWSRHLFAVNPNRNSRRERPRVAA